MLSLTDSLLARWAMCWRWAVCRGLAGALGMCTALGIRHLAVVRHFASLALSACVPLRQIAQYFLHGFGGFPPSPQVLPWLRGLPITHKYLGSGEFCYIDNFVSHIRYMAFSRPCMGWLCYISMRFQASIDSAIQMIDSCISGASIHQLRRSIHQLLQETAR